MNIFAIVRTRNEEANIERYIKSYYPIADRILVADGGSEDRTLEIAAGFKKVTIKEFDQRIEADNGIWRNPEGRHINFLIDWAESEGADWLVFDDADCFPTTALQRDARNLIETCPHAFIFYNRIYVYHDDQYFPELNEPGTSLWAWKAGELRADDDRDWHVFFPRLPEVSRAMRLDLQPPYAGLHCAWPTDEEINRKLAFYRDSGAIPKMLHPLEFGGKLAPLPEWAVT